MAQLAKLGQDDKKQAFRQGLMELKASQAGRVKDLATTTRGAVVQPGVVHTVAAGSQTPQQQAQNATIAASANNPLTYRALIKLNTQYLEQPANSSASGQAKRLPLEAGMAATAEIHQGRRSVMEYLLSPVQKVAHEAGRER